MAKKTPTSQPLTFDLPLELIAKIEACRRALALRSTSEVVREALAGFDFNRFSAPDREHRQISVRLPVALKDRLARYSRKNKISVGELLRGALGGFQVKSTKKGGGKAAPAKKKKTGSR